MLAAITAAAASGYGVVVQQASGLLENRDPSVLWLAPALILGAVIVRSVSLFLQNLATNRLALAIMRDLQVAMFDRLITADFQRLEREPVGAIISRFTNDITMLREGLIRAANNLTRDFLTVVGCLAVLFWLDWALTLVVLAVLLLAGHPITVIGKAIRKRSGDIQDQMGDVSSFLEEGFSGARMIKTFSLEDWSQTRAKGRFQQRFELLLAMVAQRARIEPIMEVAAGVALAVIFGFAGWRALNDATELSDLLGFIVAFGVMSSPIRALASLSGVLQEGFAVLDRVFALLDEQPTLTEADDAKPLVLTGGHVRVNDVSFQYEPGVDALSHITLDAKPGETIALVGPSGSGKTTLLNLIARLYDPREGSVEIDGQDIAQAQLSSLRRQLALVSQEVTLFDDTIRNNIALGKLGASDDEIIAAAKAADAHDFILGLSGGYDTQAGPKGSNLSGGQRQRVAIARAILKDAPILLLDEATSALDANSEARVQHALDELSRDRTTIVIAHRLATVRKADRIYVMKAGEIVESGDHDSLIAQTGLYAQLSALQFADG
ncbi:Lipid A export ATP-binding/permease protein MsbA [Oceanicaulis sp. 350]|nr:Lipid A export ATP-binding/permease protein MsbA [Oceanicaulis sp. 350]